MFFFVCEYCVVCASVHVCALCCVCTVFLRSGTTATVYSLFVFVRLLFEGGVYFFGKPAYINKWLGRVRTSKTVTVARHCQ